MPYDWHTELKKFLAPLFKHIRFATQRKALMIYLFGLIAQGERKSMERIANQFSIPYDRIQYFITRSGFDHEFVREWLVEIVNAMLGGPNAVLIIDDTALLKKGIFSIGVARQYAGQVGKVENCQALVTITLACGGIPFLLDIHLYLPKSWTKSKTRMKEAGVPEEWQKHLTKPQIAIAQIKALRAQGVEFGTVVTDAGYGNIVEFRRELDEMGVPYIAGIAKDTLVYPADVSLHMPERKKGQRGRKRKHPVPDQTPVKVEDLFTEEDWMELTWRTGTKGPLSAKFAKRVIRVAEGSPIRLNGKTYNLPGEKVLVVGEWRDDGTIKFHISNLPADTDLFILASKLKERWACELGHQQMKEELGLDHFEGRTWHGLHRHALMVMLTYNFIQQLRLKYPEETDDMEFEIPESLQNLIDEKSGDDADPDSESGIPAEHPAEVSSLQNPNAPADKHPEPTRNPDSMNKSEVESDSETEPNKSGNMAPGKAGGSPPSPAGHRKSSKSSVTARQESPPDCQCQPDKPRKLKLPTMPQVRDEIAMTLKIFQVILIIESELCHNCLRRLEKYDVFKLLK